MIQIVVWFRLFAFDSILSVDNSVNLFLILLDRTSLCIIRFPIARVYHRCKLNWHRAGNFIIWFAEYFRIARTTYKLWCYLQNFNIESVEFNQILIKTFRTPTAYMHFLQIISFRMIFLQIKFSLLCSLQIKRWSCNML